MRISLGQLYLQATFCIVLLIPAEGRWIKSMLTYNTALWEKLGVDTAPNITVPSLQVRRDAIIEELNRTYADIVCLQGVWYGEDAYKIIKDLESTFPYTFSSLHDSSGTIPLDGFDTTPPCPLDVLAPFAYCLAFSCSGSSASEIAACSLTSCLSEYLALPQECWTCFSAVGNVDADIILQRCTDAVPGPYRQINPPGLLLLSKRPLVDTAYTDLHPGTREVFEIGYLEAKVWPIGQIVCTHLTYYLDVPYYEVELQAIANITSWVEQGTAEIMTLIERFANKERIFLLGDFNVGSGVPSLGIIPVQPELYSLLVDDFRTDPVEACTYCSSTGNIYNYYSEYSSRIIDHIFYKGYSSHGKRRMFDKEIIDGEYPLSDHYGVIQYFCRIR